MKNKRMILGGLLACLTLMGCATTPVQQGALGLGAVGAGAGAIIGSTTGHAGEGALIGAGVGALTGALVGDAIEHSTPPPQPVYYAPGPPPSPPVVGYWQTRVVTGPTGERYEQRVWVTR
jgi:hypothetical protein